MNFMKINLEIKNKILILIYKINIYGSLNNNQKLSLNNLEFMNKNMINLIEFTYFNYIN